MQKGIPKIFGPPWVPICSGHDFQPYPKSVKSIPNISKIVCHDTVDPMTSEEMSSRGLFHKT